MTLLTLDLTQCWRDHKFDLREAYVGEFDLKLIGTAYARSLYDLEQIIMSGMIMLAPELTHCILQKWLTPPYETQGFAYATQSYDTTLLKAYSRGFWWCSIKIWLVISTPLQKYEFVSWDSEIPSWMENKIHVPNHQPDIHVIYMYI